MRRYRLCRLSGSIAWSLTASADSIQCAVKAAPFRQFRKDLQYFPPLGAFAPFHIFLHDFRHHAVDPAVPEGTGAAGDVAQIRDPVHALPFIAVEAPVPHDLMQITVHNDHFGRCDLQLDDTLAE